jgi:beta-phosphoglucomutase-like phosphatase (HAD superfamily)
VPPPAGVGLLDLDGVLVDSRAAITGAMRAALDEHGLGPFGPQAPEALIGPPLLRAVGALLGAEPGGRRRHPGDRDPGRADGRRAPMRSARRPRRCRRSRWR